MARPTSLTPEVHAELVAAARDGVSYRCLAGLARVSERTLYNWLAWGANGAEPYASFLQDIACARAEDELECARKIKAGGKGMLGAQWKLVYQYGYSQRIEQVQSVSEPEPRSAEEIVAHIARKVGVEVAPAEAGNREAESV